TTVVSAPPVRVTVDQAPKLPQVPPARVADWRSTTPLVESTPDCPSVPLSSVRSTEVLVYHGPPESEALWPVGAVESAEIVSESEALAPPWLTAVTVRLSGAV